MVHQEAAASLCPVKANLPKGCRVRRIGVNLCIRHHHADHLHGISQDVFFQPHNQHFSLSDFMGKAQSTDSMHGGIDAACNGHGCSLIGATHNAHDDVQECADCCGPNDSDGHVPGRVLCLQSTCTATLMACHRLI